MQILSRTWRAGNIAKIIVNGIDLAVNVRGLNIVVIEPRSGQLIDSASFDFFPRAKRVCIRKPDFRTIIIPCKEQELKSDGYDINSRLNKIISGYHLDEFYPKYIDSVASKQVIRDIANEWKKTDSIVCIVVGEDNEKMYVDEKHFLDALTPCQQNQVSFIRCKPKKDAGAKITTFNWNYDWEIYDFSNLELFKWEGYSNVYIVSNLGENFIGMWLRKHNVKYVALCDVLSARGISTASMGMEYYEFVHDKRESRFFYNDAGVSPTQWQYYEQSTKYNMYETVELKNVCAKKCFFLSLVVKDFLHAEEWLGNISRQDDSYERYSDAWQDVKKLLHEIVAILKKRKQKDIFAIWVDATHYERLNMMPFIMSLKDKSIWFENIFTLTGYTRETLRGIFTGRKLIDDRTGEISSINLLNSPVLRSLMEHDYQVKFFLHGFHAMVPSRYKTDSSITKFVQTPELLWDSINQLISSRKPCFIIAPIEETHPPFVSMGINDENIFSSDQRLVAASEETDRQIKFYTDMLGRNSTSLIFSDHGFSKLWPRQHVFFAIYGERYHPRKIKDLCSSIDFYKIIDWIIQGEDIKEKELAREFVEIQGVPVVSKRMEIKSNGILYQANPAFMPAFIGYKGIVTQEYVYIHFAGGREWLSRRDKLQPSPSWYARPDDICNVNLLPEMRNKAGVNYGNEPRDYGPTSPFYEATIKEYENNYDYNEEKLHLLNNLISIMPDASVALYLGNGVSKEAYLALSLENRKKIGCIIDKSVACACSDIDVPIISLEKVTEYGVHNILISTRTLPSEVSALLKKHGNIHAFGMYGWFEVNGYHTKYNFYDFAIKSMDAPLSSPVAIPDFLHYASLECAAEVAVAVVVHDEKTLLERLHGILKQVSLRIEIHCFDLTGKVADVIKDYQKVESAIKVISIDDYASMPAKLNELLSSVNSKYIFFLSAAEYLHAKGLFYLHEIAEKTEADVAAAGAVLKAEKKVGPSLADFAEGDFELKKEARVLPATFKERSAELNEEDIPDFAGNKLYRVDFLRKYGIRFQDIKSGWKDIFCFQTIFGAPKYVKAASPVCISSGNADDVALEDNSAEYAKKLVESMFAYQQAIEAMLKQWGGFGNNPSLCDAFRERAMTIFDQQHFSGIALDDEIRKAVSQTVQEELQKNPSIGMWWIKYLFMRSSFPQNV